MSLPRNRRIKKVQPSREIKGFLQKQANAFCISRLTLANKALKLSEDSACSKYPQAPLCPMLCHLSESSQGLRHNILPRTIHVAPRPGDEVARVDMYDNRNVSPSI